MSFILRIVERADGGPDVEKVCGRFVRSYTPDGYHGRGYLVVTDDPARALIFPDAAAAHECWRSTSSTHPRRDDGKPNRPLTAYTVEVMQGSINGATRCH